MAAGGKRPKRGRANDPPPRPDARPAPPAPTCTAQGSSSASTSSFTPCSASPGSDSPCAVPASPSSAGSAGAGARATAASWLRQAGLHATYQALPLTGVQPSSGGARPSGATRSRTNLALPPSTLAPAAARAAAPPAAASPAGGGGRRPARAAALSPRSSAGGGPSSAAGGAASATGGVFDVDARILARFRRGPRFYPGRVAAANADGSYAVAYDDGDYEEAVLPKHVKAPTSTATRPRGTLTAAIAAADSPSTALVVRGAVFHAGQVVWYTRPRSGMHAWPCAILGEAPRRPGHWLLEVLEQTEPCVSSEADMLDFVAGFEANYTRSSMPVFRRALRAAVVRLGQQQPGDEPPLDVQSRTLWLLRPTAASAERAPVLVTPLVPVGKDHHLQVVRVLPSGAISVPQPAEQARGETQPSQPVRARAAEVYEHPGAIPVLRSWLHEAPPCETAPWASYGEAVTFREGGWPEAAGGWPKASDAHGSRVRMLTEGPRGTKRRAPPSPSSSYCASSPSPHRPPHVTPARLISAAPPPPAMAASMGAADSGSCSSDTTPPSGAAAAKAALRGAPCLWRGGEAGEAEGGIGSADLLEGSADRRLVLVAADGAEAEGSWGDDGAAGEGGSLEEDVEDGDGDEGAEETEEEAGSDSSSAAGSDDDDLDSTDLSTSSAFDTYAADDDDDAQEAFVQGCRRAPALDADGRAAEDVRWYLVYLLRTGAYLWCTELALRPWCARRPPLPSAPAGKRRQPRPAPKPPARARAPTIEARATRAKAAASGRRGAAPRKVRQTLPRGGIGKLAGASPSGRGGRAGRQRAPRATQLSLAERELASRRAREVARRAAEHRRDRVEWRQWSAADGSLCVRSVSWPRVDAFMRRMKTSEANTAPKGEEASSMADDVNFNIDYIIRQLQAMSDGPKEDELHVLLQLQRGSPPETGYLAPASETLGVIAATVAMSRRIVSVEFKAIYVLPTLRGKNLANKLVHFALSDVCQQSIRLRGQHVPKQLQWDNEQLRSMMAFVVLPHCMQTSSRFWAKVGFELGAKVDRKEHKQATLPSVANLTGDVNGWRLRCVDLSSLPAEGATGGTDSLTPSTE